MLNRICGIFSETKEAMNTIKTTAIIVGVVIVSLVILIAVCKNELARWIFGGLITICLAITMAFSAIHLNKYYNTKGGIIGKIQSIFDVNTIEIEETDKTINFEFGDVMLVQYEDDDYRAEFNTEDYIELADNECWLVFCNDVPCEVIEYSTDYMIAEYSYLFYDEYLDPKLEDTLYFKFAFYKGTTRLIVMTTGGSNAVSLWNSYFQKNDFIVTLDSTKGEYVNGFELVEIKLADELNMSYKSYFIKIGSNFTLPTYDDIESNYNFLGWSLDKTNVIDSSKIVVTEDATYYAIWKRKDVELELQLQGASISVNGTKISADTTLTLDGDSTLTLSLPEYSGKVFWCYEITASGYTKKYTTEELSMTLEAFFDDILGIDKYIPGSVPDRTNLKIVVNFYEYVDSAEYEARVNIASKLGFSTNENNCLYSNENLIKTIYEYLVGVGPEEIMTESEICEAVLNAFSITENNVTYTQAVNLLNEYYS